MNPDNHPAMLVGDRQMVATRTFDAPRELVWNCWTDPRHIGTWWGPTGFYSTTFAMDVRPGGVWRFVMHGPDGRDYENKIIYIEVDAPSRLVYQHGGDKECEPVSFWVTVTFDQIGSQTRVRMQMDFPSSNARDYVVKEYGALQGLEDNCNRMGEYVQKAQSEDEPFVITRVLQAPRDLVWKAWTERGHLMQWFGPRGFTMPVATLDFREGGQFHYMMRAENGFEMWGKFEYQQIIPQQRIVLVNSFSDKDGGLGRHPMAPDWPARVISTTTFAEHQGQTTMTTRSTPLHPTAIERDTFNKGRPGMVAGWTGTFEQLEAYLAKIQ